MDENALGELIAIAERLEQLGNDVGALVAVPHDVESKPFTVGPALGTDDEEGGREPVAETVRQAGKEMVASKVVEEIGTNRVADEVGTEGIFHLLDRLHPL